MAFGGPPLFFFVFCGADSSSGSAEAVFDFGGRPMFFLFLCGADSSSGSAKAVFDLKIIYT